ncbi:MAG: NAD-dependent epimerase/dehydratase family protein [Bacteroidota bacterium]
MKRIFVTGGTGFLGSYLLRYLVQGGGVRVRALKRANSDMRLVVPVADQIEWIEGDILDISVLEDAMQDVDQVYHAAAIVSYSPNDRDQMHEVNVQGTANVVDVALDSNIKKLVYVSSIAALGRIPKSNRLDERAEWQGDEGQSQYAITKYLAELEVWRGIAEGLNAAMINPSVILGGGFWKRGTGKLFMNAWKAFSFYPQGGTGFVDVRDVAKAAIRLMQSDITAERYIINGANWSYKEQMDAMSSTLGKKSPRIKVTPIIQEVAWRAAALSSLLLRRTPFITKETARMSANRFYYDASKSIADLNLSYTPLGQTIQETAQLLKKAAKDGFAPKYLPLN